MTAPIPLHGTPASILMLEEAATAVKPSALAHAIAAALVRQYGPDGASKMADAIVGNVQALSRDPSRLGPTVPPDMCELGDGFPDRPHFLAVCAIAGACALIFAALVTFDPMAAVVGAM